MAYIIDLYNKWDRWDREHSVYKFQLNERWWAIKEVELEWGLPILPSYTDKDLHPEDYIVYGTQEDAMNFIFNLRQLN